MGHAVNRKNLVRNVEPASIPKFLNESSDDVFVWLNGECLYFFLFNSSFNCDLGSQIPPSITPTGARRVAKSCNGLPSTNTRSARLPVSTVPLSSRSPRNFAGFVVAVCSASKGVKPA